MPYQTPYASDQRPAAATDQPSRRKGGRIRVEDYRCDLGRLLDLGPRGMRIRSRRSLEDMVGSHIATTIRANGGPELRVRATVRWSKKIGYRKHAVGLSFDELNPATRALLTQMASCAGHREYGWSGVT